MLHIALFYVMVHIYDAIHIYSYLPPVHHNYHIILTLHYNITTYIIIFQAMLLSKQTSCTTIPILYYTYIHSTLLSLVMTIEIGITSFIL